MKGLQLLATGGALPGRVVTNEDLRRQVDTSDEWITTRTGICQRYYCTENEDAATLAVTAARQALTRSGLAANDIACCVVATLSAPTATPSIACRVQAALGLPENRPAFDVNAACSGFIYAAAAAHGLLSTLGGRYALVIGCEALSRMVDPTDRTTCVLFGDGAGAAVFELAENAPFAVTLGARGSEAIRAGGIADGRGLAAALALGACGVQVGTCLLASTECPIHENYKAALLKARDSDTIVTGRIGGTPVRVLKNRMSREYVRQEKAGADKMALERFTLGSLRKAVFDGDTENGSLMAGQAAGLLHEVRPVEEIFAAMVSEAKDCIAGVYKEITL